HDLLNSLMAAVAEDGLSVVLSSHAVTELERIADYLVVPNGGRLQLAGEVERVLARHKILTGPDGEVDLVADSAPGEGGSLGAWRACTSRAGQIVRTYLRRPGPELSRSMK